MNKQNLSGRSRHACLACRAGKVKCDGNDICSKCARKGIECKYGQDDDSQRDESPSWDEITDVPVPQTSGYEITAPPAQLLRDGTTSNSLTSARPPEAGVG